MRSPWFHGDTRMVHLHLREFPSALARHFSAQAFVDELERGHINLVVLPARCPSGHSCYQTHVGYPHPSLACDFLMEAAIECKRRGIRSLASYPLCRDQRVWTQAPDWRFTDAAGRTSGDGIPEGALCLNSPYKDHYVMPQLAEIAATYPVDGFFLDAPFPGDPGRLCFCAFCRRKWQTELGLALSPGLPRDVQARLSMRTLVTCLTEIRDLIARTDPRLVLCVNEAGTPGVSRTVKDLCEIGVWEWPPQPADSLGHSFAARLARNDVPNVVVSTTRSFQGRTDTTLKPADQLITEFAAMIGNGVPASCIDPVGAEGTLQHAVYDTLREAFGFVAAREEILSGAESVPYAAVLLPVPDSGLPFAFALGEAGPAYADAGPWRGAHRLLVENHVQFQMLYSVLVEDLDRYALVILPEPGAYQPGLHEKLRHYVSGGGTLVAVGRSLLQDGCFHLEDVFGIRYLEPFGFDAVYFRPAPSIAMAADDLPLQVRGQAFKVQRRGAEELAALYFPGVQNHSSRLASGLTAAPERSPFPFATLHRYGSGQAVYIAASLFDIYWQTSHPWLRQFVDAVLRYADPAPLCEVDAPGTVEANLMRRGSDLLLNLVHYSLGHPGRQGAASPVEAAHPARNVACSVRGPRPERVVLEPGGEPLPFTWEEGACRFTVPEVGQMAIVRLAG